MAPCNPSLRPLAGAICRPATERLVLGALLLLWGAAVAGGMLVMIAYTNTAGEAGHPPMRAAGANRSDRAGKEFTLWMFVHPKCPCSRASMKELASTMAACGDAIEARVWFYRPEAEPDAWAHTDLWSSATSIPGVSVHIDPAGRRAAAFGAITSGQVLLYDRGGRLCFQGGITAGRGHEGDNVGSAAIERIVGGDRTERASSPVFGCRITGPCRPRQD